MTNGSDPPANPPPLPARLVGSVYATAQGLFCLDTRDQFVARALIEEGRFGQDELTMLRLFLTDQSRVLMLGGHVGSLVVPLARTVGAITVLEANPDTYELLRINLALNGSTNVTAYNLAANDVNGPLEFVLNTVNSGGSKRMPKERDADYFHDAPAVRQVPGVRLDDLLVGQRFDLIFMDIEGSEYFAMRGMPGLIATTPVVVAEFLPPHLDRVAGITVDDFLAPLAEFTTLVAPSLRQTVHGLPAMRALLEHLCATGQGDAGLVFHRQHITVNFLS